MTDAERIAQLERERDWAHASLTTCAAPLTYDVYVRDEALLAELGIVEHER